MPKQWPWKRAQAIIYSVLGTYWGRDQVNNDKSGA